MNGGCANVILGQSACATAYYRFYDPISRRIDRQIDLHKNEIYDFCSYLSNNCGSVCFHDPDESKLSWIMASCMGTLPNTVSV